MFFGSSYFLKIYLCLGVFLYFIRFFVLETLFAVVWLLLANCRFMFVLNLSAKIFLDRIFFSDKQSNRRILLNITRLFEVISIYSYVLLLISFIFEKLSVICKC